MRHLASLVSEATTLTMLGGRVRVISRRGEEVNGGEGVKERVSLTQ